MRNETSFVRSAMGALERYSFQHSEIASKCPCNKVDEKASAAVRISFCYHGIRMLNGI